MKACRFFGPVFLLASVVSAGPAEEWRQIRYGELKVGHVHITRSRENKKGKSLHRTDVERVLSYFEGRQVTLSSQETYLERDDGTLVEFSYVGVSTAGKKTIRGEVRGDKVYYLVSTPNEGLKEMELAWNRETVGPRKADALIRSKGFTEGVFYTFTVYSFAVSAPVLMSVTIKGKEKVRIGGRERTLNRLKIWGADLVGADRKKIVRQRWVDDRGGFVMEKDPCMGERSERVCTKAEAVGPARGVVTKCVVQGAVKVRGDVIRPRFVRSAVFVLEGPEGLKKVKFRGPGQTGRKLGRGVRVNVQIPKASSSPARRPVTDKTKAAFLQANYFLDFDQEGVTALAERVAGGEKDAMKAAEALRMWTFCNLEKKPLNFGMASASTAIAVGEGDSVEHAVVLAALCRAAGIPARLAGGLQVVGAVAYIHAWTEVWTGTWTPLDATQESPWDAARIRFAESDLNETSADAVLVGIAGLFLNARGRMSIGVQIYGIRGLSMVPGDPPKNVHRMRGNAYFHTLYGFGFTKPESFRFQEHLQGIDSGLIAIMGRGGHGERVLFRVSTVPYHQRLEDLLRSMEANFDLADVRKTRVAGRPAVMAKMSLRGRPGFSPLACYVRVGNTLYTIESTDSTMAVRSAFEQVLKTVVFKD